MDIAISDETKHLESKDQTLIRELILTSAKELGLDSNYELSITLVDNKKIQEIGRASCRERV